MDFEQFKKRLSGLDTTCICDADKESRTLGLVDSAIRPLCTGLKLIGRAHTVRCHEDFLMVIKALHDAEPDEVIVIDSQDSRRALTGDLFLTEAKRQNLAGIVIDGPCRDTATIRNFDLPYYARCVSCMAGTASKILETQVPVNCGGVIVKPGDVVFGDDDGLLVGTVEQFGEIIDAAASVQRKEQRMRQQMSQGVSLFDMLNFDEHYELVRAGEESKLEFLV